MKPINFYHNYKKIQISKIPDKIKIFCLPYTNTNKQYAYTVGYKYSQKNIYIIELHNFTRLWMLSNEIQI